MGAFPAGRRIIDQWSIVLSTLFVDHRHPVKLLVDVCCQGGGSTTLGRAKAYHALPLTFCGSAAIPIIRYLYLFCVG